MIKRFLEWIKLKGSLHDLSKDSIPLFKEGEVWWCSVGENVGSEINGKGHHFTRPVIIYKKLDHYTFMGIPLTSKIKTGSWFVYIKFKGDQTAMLNQLRLLSAKRLRYRIGMLDEIDYEKVKTGFHRLYL